MRTAQRTGWQYHAVFGCFFTGGLFLLVCFLLEKQIAKLCNRGGDWFLHQLKGREDRRSCAKGSVSRCDPSHLSSRWTLLEGRMQLSYLEIAQNEEIGPLRSSEEKGPCDSQVFIFPTSQEDELVWFVQMHNCILTEAKTEMCFLPLSSGLRVAVTGAENAKLEAGSRWQRERIQRSCYCNLDATSMIIKNIVMYCSKTWCVVMCMSRL